MIKIRNVCIILAIVFLLLAIGSLAIGEGYPVSTTVNGVDFVLDPYAQIVKNDGNTTYFKIKDGMYGYITSPSSREELNGWVENDYTYDYYVSKVNFNNVDGYSFVDFDFVCEGYFLVFQKDNKDFIYLIETDGSSTQGEYELMVEMMRDFTMDNTDLKPIN